MGSLQFLLTTNSAFFMKMSEPVKTEEPDDFQDGRESPSFEGLLDPDTTDGEKQEVEPKINNNSRNKIMGAAALAVLLIVGVSVVAWHFTKQEPDVDSFGIGKLYSGGITTAGGVEGVSGCQGKMVVKPPFKRGNIEKVDTNGFSQHWEIKANKKKNRARTEYIKIEGTCCWEISDRHGETEDFALGQEKEPRIAYIFTIKTKKC